MPPLLMAPGTDTAGKAHASVQARDQPEHVCLFLLLLSVSSKLVLVGTINSCDVLRLSIPLPASLQGDAVCASQRFINLLEKGTVTHFKQGFSHLKGRHALSNERAREHGASYGLVGYETFLQIVQEPAV